MTTYLNCEKCGKPIPEGEQNSDVGYQLGEVWCNACADADYAKCETRAAQESWPLPAGKKRKP